MKLLKTITSITMASSILLSINASAVQTGGNTYVTECEYMPVNVFTIPLVDTHESSTGYVSCPATKVTTDWVMSYEFGIPKLVKKTVHYQLFHEKKYLK
ncbi:hypothetical protein [Aliikangiella coralliicola]|uniref:Uncharacterized protein n=1 Tax=Aliikangiella coralliicola TaxID=2592383 RepID=A0A545UEM8_9GAMM|nr:hypothetical protein [Aliikangiella coralliicola]TQV87927.1 hypothetical protein FLL46_11150 [Aliikangiella coralliicola]